MATVAEVTARYENFLLPVLAPRDGVCGTCKRSILSGWTLCYQCNEHLRLPRKANVVVPIALAVKGEQWTHELSSYKNSPRDSVRAALGTGVGAVLWRWLENHETCIAECADVEEFPIVAAVPSTRGREPHPLSLILTHTVKPTADRYADLLRPNPNYPSGSRDARADRYLVGERLSGEPVLLIDDQWTSGGHAQSAACALKLAGAGPVAVVALGRHFDRRPERHDYREAAEAYYRAARSQEWSWDACCLCNPHVDQARRLDSAPDV